MKICLLRQNDNTPTDYLTGGESQFDFTDDIVLNDVAQELNEVGSLKESGIISASLPKTQKNRFFVQQYASKPNSDIFEIPVRIWVDGYQVNENIIRSNGGNDRFWEIEFVADNWVYRAKSTKLYNVNGYSPYIFNAPYVDAQSNLEQGAGASNGIVFPLANYGGFHKFNGVSFEQTFLDFRPWFYGYKLLKNALCLCGVNFVCPFLETGLGKNLIFYIASGAAWQKFLLPPNDNTIKHLELPGNGKSAFMAISTANQTVTGTPGAGWLVGNKILFQNDATGAAYDTGGTLGMGGTDFGLNGFWDSSVSKQYHARGKWKYKAVMWVSCPQTISVTVKMELDSDPALMFLNSAPKTVLVQGGTKTRIEYNFELETPVPTYGLALTVELSDPTKVLTIDAGATFEGKAQTVVMAYYSYGTSGQIVYPQSYINPDMTVMELVEGMAHIIGAKMDFDQATNTVKMLTDFDTYVTGDHVQGFYNPGQVDFDLSGRELCDTRITDLEQKGIPCKFTFGFKDSTDEYVQDTQENEPFQKVVNLSGLAKKCEDDGESKNPLFEPTIERQADEIKPTTGTAPIIPVLLDNLSGALSTSIGARVAVYFGPVNQRLTASTNRSFRRTWTGLITDNHEVIFYASQLPTEIIKEVGGTTTFLKGKRPVLSYGESADSLYKFHRKELLSDYLGKKLQLDAYSRGVYDWKEINFRRGYILNTNGAAKRYSLLEKEYESGTRKITLTLMERGNRACLCPYPCDGDITAQEIGKHEKFLPNGTYNYQVNYFRLNGVDIINTPYLYAITVTAGSFFTAPLGGQYLKSDVDALNSFFQLFAPNIKLSYATSMNRMNIEFPSCYSFAVEIIDSPSSSADGIRLTENGITHITLDGGATWYAAGAAFLGTSINSKLLPPSGIKFSNQCNAAD